MDTDTVGGQMWRRGWLLLSQKHMGQVSASVRKGRATAGLRSSEGMRSYQGEGPGLGLEIEDGHWAAHRAH